MYGLVCNHGKWLLRLLLGSRANTNSDGLLNSPAPDRFMAVILNSYSIPSTTSFTAYFFSGCIKEKKKLTL